MSAPTSAIESVLVENRVFPPPAAFTAQANRSEERRVGKEC